MQLTFIGADSSSQNVENCFNMLRSVSTSHAIYRPGWNRIQPEIFGDDEKTSRSEIPLDR